MREHQAQLFATDFVFLEAPRWRHGRLWVSDVFDCKIFSLKPDGSRYIECHLAHRPSGLGFLPDGTLIAASARDRKLVKIVNGEAIPYADLSPWAPADVNDFAVDESGRIYVGNFGYDFHGGAPLAPTDLHLVESNGSITVAASGLEFPNGAVIINKGRTLVVAETWARRLRAFDIDSSGKLSNGRIYADLLNREPDGICADVDDGLWVSCFNTGEIIRIAASGEITDRILGGTHAISCHLGGTDGRTLFCTVHTGTEKDMEAQRRLSAIKTVRVEIPGAVAAPSAL